MLQPEASVESFGVPNCFLSAKNIKPESILQIVVDQKNVDAVSPLQTYDANGLALHIQKGEPSDTLLGPSECHYHGKCVKFRGLKLILLYY